MDPKTNEASAFFQGLFDYDHWANRQTVSMVERPAPGWERGLRIFGHVLGAQRLWLARFETPFPAAGFDPWPVLELDECRDQVDALYGRWGALLGRFGAGSLEAPLRYRTTKGVEFRTPIRDVLTQVVLHGVHHRGQIAGAVREAGGTPEPLDFIAYVRRTQGG